MLKLDELGKALQEARKRVRLSQTTVGARLGVTRQVVSAYESGKRDVSATELYTLCNLFRVTPDQLLGYLRRSDHDVEAPLNFRMNNDYQLLSDHDRHEIAAIVQRAQNEESSYLRWLDSHQKYSTIPENSFRRFKQLTERIRLDFGQDDPPINIYLLVEGLGISVAPTVLDKVAAVVCRADKDRKTSPWIAVNSSQPLSRQRFSIAHELAHLLLHEEQLVFHAHYFRRQSEQKEVDADAFAAELLVPRSLLEKSIESLKAQSIEEATFLLSHLYQVSFAAMATRLYSLQMVTRAKFDDLGKVKPSKLAESMSQKVAKRLFIADSVLRPLVTQESKLNLDASGFTQEAVRKIQEIAYTRYLGFETKGGTDPQTVYDLESAGTVYEKVALWVADNYPLFSAAPQ